LPDVSESVSGKADRTNPLPTEVRPSCGGHVEGTYALVAIPNDAVEGLLPSSLELADTGVTPEGTHPVFAVFIKHHDVFEINGPSGVAYHESIVLIPGVKVKGHEDQFMYMPSLWLDNDTPIQIGRDEYGFNKKRADIYDDQNGQSEDYTVFDSYSGNLLASATIEKPATIDAPSFAANFGKVGPLLATPIISFLNGQTACSDIAFDVAHATVEPRAITFSIDPQYTGLVKPFALGATHVPGLDQSVTGAYFISADWTLTAARDASTCFKR
jgi:hypothetical protein